ncbi:MAG: hypothetical protein R6U20_08255 [Longimonas sp.]|uniref:hypothetical protein n=1 Tax=Longimonas sp. TaxID=2039626 RepID=UPI003975250C
MPSDSTHDTASRPEPSNRSERRVERFTWLGRVVQVSGIAHRWSRRAAHTLHARTTAVAARSRKAFYEGLDPNIDDATVVDEDPPRS